jgi:hypothetical protein
MPRLKLTKRRVILVLIAGIAAVASFVAGIRPRTRFGPLPVIEPISGSATQDTGNVALYISNMAFQPDVVDIRVEIDGRTVVHGAFECDVRTTHTRYRLDLPPGEHRLRAETQRGQAVLEEAFSLKDEIHIGLSYYYREPGLLNGETRPMITFHAEDRSWIPDWAWRPGR